MTIERHANHQLTAVAEHLPTKLQLKNKQKLDNWITLKIFTYPTEVVVLRGRLEAEGIECLVLNELTTQVNPLYSNAIGGVQLQVKESDLQNAIAILIEGGYLTDHTSEPSKIFPQLDKTTSKIPVLQKLPLLFRLLILLAVVLGSTVALLVYATLPTSYEKLTANNWCLDNVVYDNKSYIPHTDNFITIFGMGFCEEGITFRTNGTVTLPGFNSRTVSGKWRLTNNLLHISSVDTFDFVYNGAYKIEFTNRGLVLASDKTSLHCRPENVQIRIPF